MEQPAEIDSPEVNAFPPVRDSSFLIQQRKKRRSIWQLAPHSMQCKDQAIEQKKRLSFGNMHGFASATCINSQINKPHHSLQPFKSILYASPVCPLHPLYISPLKNV